MSKINRLVLMVALFVATAVATSKACALGVEDFESYANTAALSTAWFDTAGSPVQTLEIGETGFVHGGSKAMKLQYDCGPDPFLNQWTYSFGSNQNWSGFGQFNMWVRSVAGATSLEHLTFQLKDEFGNPLGSSTISTQIGNTWTPWDVNLSGFTNLANVRQISFTVSAFDVVNGYGAGTLYFDDMSVAAIPEPGTFGLMLLGGLGLVVAVRKSRQTQERSATR